MTAKIVDGKEIASKIKENLQSRIEVGGRAPRLDIVIVGENPVTATFVQVKRRFANDIGVDFYEHTLAESATTEEIIEVIKSIPDEASGIVVQLPLPKHVDTNTVLAAIPTKKDIDVLSKNAFGHFVAGDSVVIPPVAGAVKEILSAYNISLKGVPTTVIGKGRLVGAPVIELLQRSGASVTLIDSRTSKEEFSKALAGAAIVISGAGVPNLIKAEHIAQDTVLIDAGTSSSGGAVSGDICSDCAENARLISKTPGGVGPITVAFLFKNLVNAAYE